MKKGIITITLIFCFLLQGLRAYPVIYNNIKNARIPYEAILGLVAKDLGLDTLEFKLYISEANIWNSSTGSVCQIPGGITLIVNDGAIKIDAVHVFIHELVHVSQIMTNRLMIRRNGYWFNGVKVNMNQPDYLLPHESEAIEISERLCNMYRKEIKKLIRS